jgi:hypothetical protein
MTVRSANPDEVVIKEIACRVDGLQTGPVKVGGYGLGPVEVGDVGDSGGAGEEAWVEVEVEIRIEVEVGI